MKKIRQRLRETRKNLLSKNITGNTRLLFLSSGFMFILIAIYSQLRRLPSNPLDEVVVEVVIQLESLDQERFGIGLDHLGIRPKALPPAQALIPDTI